MIKTEIQNDVFENENACYGHILLNREDVNRCLLLWLVLIPLFHSASLLNALRNTNLLINNMMERGSRFCQPKCIY